MDKSVNHILTMFITITVLLFSSASNASGALSNVIKLSQGENISVTSGNVLTVDVVGENFIMGPNGAGFSLNWNPAVLSYVSNSLVSPPWNPLGNGSSVSEDNASSGSLDFVFLTMDTGNAGTNFGLGSFTFNVLGSSGDLTALTLGNDAYSIGFINGVTGLNVNYISSHVQVVPLPAAIWMFGAGLAGMLGTIKRRRHA
jgi:hypothetical protein